MFPSIITDTSITVLFPSGPKTVVASHLNFKQIREAIATRAAGLEELFDVKAAITRWTNGLYTITEDGVFCNSDQLPDCIERRVIQFMEEGLPFEPLLKFHERLRANPSRRAVQELYKFLENKNIPIGPDGFFYGYKSVRLDWTDCYTGKFVNTIGSTLSMPRNQVDDDCSRTCSYGFHVGALEYVASFGGSRDQKHMIIVKVDPADVVSVPLDYNGQKMRVCKYTVVAEYTGPLPETYYEVPEDDPEEIEEDEGRFCYICETELEEDWVVCPYCGS